LDPRIFGLDPQTLFDTCVTLVAMLALFILLSYLLFNPARKLIQKRKDFIRQQLDEAEAAKQEALTMKEEYDNHLAKVEDESAALLAEARQKAKSRAEEIVSEAGDEAHRIVTRAEKEVALEKDKVRDDMKQEMVQVASLMAGRFVSRSMDEATQAELIDETLKEMGEGTWQD
jgi:F-type H+-transporting ATPase subunit b